MNIEDVCNVYISNTHFLINQCETVSLCIVLVSVVVWKYSVYGLQVHC